MTNQAESFVLVVRDAHDQHNQTFILTAFFRGAPLASTTIPATLPLLKPVEIERAAEWLQRGSIDAAFAQEFGKRLFETLFPPPILKALDEAQSALKLSHGRAGLLRLVLYLPQALHALPWELMYDNDDGFLARSASAPISRHFAGLPPSPPPPSDGPLRILVITASPPGYPALTHEIEAETIQQIMEQGQSGLRRGFAILRHRINRADDTPDNLPVLTKLVTVAVLPHATRATIRRAIDEAQGNERGYHVIHFVGHGVAQEDGSYLLLESEPTAPNTTSHGTDTNGAGANGVDAKGAAEAQESGDFIRADEFAQLVENPSLHLVFLNACQTGRALDIFNGAANGFFRRGAAIVIGMQTEILDKAALRFAQEFYQSWATRAPFERALASARQLAVSDAQGAAADWAIPVIYAGPDAALDLKLQLPALQAIRPLVMTWKGVMTIVLLLGVIATFLNAPNLWPQAHATLTPLRCWYRDWGWLGNPNALDAGFNAVMAPITVATIGGGTGANTGDSGPTDGDARLLADQVWAQFTQSLARNERLDVSYALRAADQTCPIRGTTPDARRQSAEALARHFNANLVVYGVIQAGQDQESASFQPEFWVNYGGFAENADINGLYALGRPVMIDLPVELRNFQGTIHPASARIEALSLMAVGLAALAQNEYATAIANLTLAENLPGWHDWQGKQIVHLWLGNAYLVQANEEPAQQVHEDALAAALAHYQKALEIAADQREPLPRAQLGVGSVQYIQARSSLDRLIQDYHDFPAASELPLYQQALRKEYLPAPDSAALSELARRIADLNKQLEQTQALLQGVLQAAQGGEYQQGNLEANREIALRATFNLAQLYIARQDLVTFYDNYKAIVKDARGEPLLPSLQWMPKAYTMLFDILCQSGSDAQGAACAHDDSISVAVVCQGIAKKPTLSGELAGYALARMALIASVYETNMDAAKLCYEQALRWIPDHAKADYYLKLASLYRSQRELDAAMHYYQQTIKQGEGSNRANQVRLALRELRETQSIQIQRAKWGH